MTQELLLLAVGFLLTGVLGTALGYFFQRRAWDHQHEVERREDEHQRAVQTFEEIASLMDRRLYRMRRLHWAALRHVESGEGLDRMSAALAGYDDVLVTWNDNLNRILTLVDTSFGHGLRRQLEVEVYEDFAAVGRALEEFVRQVSRDRTGVEVPPLKRRLDTLGHRVYRLDSQMLGLVRDGHVGQHAPRTVTTAASAGLPVLQFGQTGPHVRRLQRALRRAGDSQVSVDGGFGPMTEQALRSFQQSRGLDVDGIAGPGTWNALPSGARMPLLREGSKGDVVRELQAALSEYAEGRWKTAPSRIDGTFGADVTASVEAFQRWHGLPVDGIVGDRTWAAGLDTPDNTLEGRVGLQHVRD